VHIALASGCGADNIELSCAAESPARSEPQQRHLYEPEDNLRRQLQRFVMYPPLNVQLDLTRMLFASVEGSICALIAAMRSSELPVSRIPSPFRIWPPKP